MLQLPKASLKYMSQFIPVVVAAFLCDIGIYEQLPIIRNVANVTPSDKCLKRCILLNHQHFYYSIAKMIKKGAVFGLAHDKGEKSGLGRLAQEIGCQNVGKNIDPLYDEGIISLRLNANGVVANDESIAEHIENSFVNVDPYLEDQEVVEISTYTTDSGGGGGTVEGQAIALTQ